LSRHVKGVLFADYVRMIRGHKSVDYKTLLAPEDLPFLDEKIVHDKWYPMATFERMGNAILRTVANSDLRAVQMWGRFSADQLRALHPMLVADGDALETLGRFRVMRATFFDFEAIEIPMVTDEQAHVIIRYHMGPTAEEAASFQTMGFFERQLELAGARDVTARFITRSWAGDPETLVELSWKM
jgi:hypothetical protein